jgi:manganese-dependent inorganic pyrophosphatase
VVTEDEEGFARAFGKKLENNRVYVEGILSRKKQVLPKMLEVFDK